jgi:hypothetical protein
MWFRVNVPGIGVGYRYGSSVYLNANFALTSAHTVTDLLQYNPTYQVGTGANYITNAGNSVSATVLVYPGFDPSNPGQTIDLAIIHFAQPIAGPTVRLTNAAIGDVLSHAGFGDYGTPSTGEIHRDGNSRAFNAVLDTLPPLIGYTTNYYCSTDFGPYISGNGKGLSGDSGGGVFDANRNLIGIMSAQTGNTDGVGSTIFLNLTSPDILSWITSNTSLPAVRPVLSLDGLGNLTTTGATNQVYGIQASINLQDWQEILVVTNQTGSVSVKDTNAGEFQARFYRAVLK